jgi:hypothetical protein
MRAVHPWQKHITVTRPARRRDKITSTAFSAASHRGQCDGWSALFLPTVLLASHRATLNYATGPTSSEPVRRSENRPALVGCSAFLADGHLGRAMEDAEQLNSAGLLLER